MLLNSRLSLHHSTDYSTDENENSVEIIDVSDHRRISFSENSIKKYYSNSLNSADDDKKWAQAT